MEDSHVIVRIPFIFTLLFVGLINLLVPSNMEALLEAARVFGNLTHQKAVRDFLADNKGEKFSYFTFEHFATNIYNVTLNFGE